jgi:histidine ammonia-lyase
VYENVETVLAIELFTAAQALDFRKPLKPGESVEKAYQIVREAIPHATEDHYFKDDINKAVELIHQRKLIKNLNQAEYHLQ